MYIVRDIFNLKYGHFRPVKALMEEAMKKGMMPNAKSRRVLSDFTGEYYRLIMETGFDTLADFEKEFSTDMSNLDWQDWYKKFTEHVEGGQREILKVVI